MTDDRNPGGAPAAASTSTGTLMNIARGAKGIALLAFLLPWVTVSCAGQTLASITGLQLATGSIQPVGNAGGMPGAPTGATATPTDYSPDIFVLIAAVLIVASLVVTFVMPRRRAAMIAMIGSAVAAALVIFDVFVRIKGAVMDQVRAGSSGSQPSTGAGGEFERQMQQQMEQMTQAISVNPALGFWLCVLALVAAVVLNKMVHGRRTEP